MRLRVLVVVSLQITGTGITSTSARFNIELFAIIPTTFQGYDSSACVGAIFSAGSLDLQGNINHLRKSRGSVEIDGIFFWLKRRIGNYENGQSEQLGLFSLDTF